MNFKKISFITGLAVSGISVSGVFTPANAVNFVVSTDDRPKLDIEWTISPVDLGGVGGPTFDIPTNLKNWQIISANYKYNGGGTPSNVVIQVRHIVAPDLGDKPAGEPASLSFSFDYTPSGNGSSAGTSVSVPHNFIGHQDDYQLNWKYSYPSGSGGILTTQLIGTHTGGTAIPEPLTILGATTAVGFGSFFKRKRKLSESSENENTKDS